MNAKIPMSKKASITKTPFECAQGRKQNWKNGRPEIRGQSLRTSELRKRGSHHPLADSLEAPRTQRVARKSYGVRLHEKISKLIFPPDPPPITLNACALRSCFAGALAILPERQFKTHLGSRLNSPLGFIEESKILFAFPRVMGLFLRSEAPGLVFSVTYPWGSSVGRTRCSAKQRLPGLEHWEKEKSVNEKNQMDLFLFIYDSLLNLERCCRA